MPFSIPQDDRIDIKPSFSLPKEDVIDTPKIASSSSSFSIPQDDQLPASTPSVPEPLGIFGQAKLGVKAIGKGLQAGFADEMGRAVGGIIEGKDVRLKDTSPVSQYIARQGSESEAKALTPEEAETKVFGVKAGTLQSGLSNLGYSAANLLPAAAAQVPGRIAGAEAGLVVAGPPGAAVGALIGGNATSAAASYNASKRADMNMVLRQKRDELLKINPNMTEQEWEGVKQGIDAEVEKHGTAEGKWEAFGNAAQLAIMGLVGKWGKMIPLKPVLAKPLSVVGGAALDIPIEVGSEALTQQDQAAAENAMGLREDGANLSFGEAIGEVGPQTLVTTIATMGLGGTAAHVIGGVKDRANKKAATKAEALKAELQKRQDQVTLENANDTTRLLYGEAIKSGLDHEQAMEYATSDDPQAVFDRIQSEQAAHEADRAQYPTMAEQVAKSKADMAATRQADEQRIADEQAQADRLQAVQDSVAGAQESTVSGSQNATLNNQPISTPDAVPVSPQAGSSSGYSGAGVEFIAPAILQAAGVQDATGAGAQVVAAQVKAHVDTGAPIDAQAIADATGQPVDVGALADAIHEAKQTISPPAPAAPIEQPIVADTKPQAEATAGSPLKYSVVRNGKKWDITDLSGKVVMTQIAKSSADSWANSMNTDEEKALKSMGSIQNRPLNTPLSQEDFRQYNETQAKLKQSMQDSAVKMILSGSPDAEQIITEREGAEKYAEYKAIADKLSAKPPELMTPEKLVKQFDDGEMSGAEIYEALQAKEDKTEKDQKAIDEYERGYREYVANGMRMDNFSEEYMIQELRKKPRKAAKESSIPQELQGPEKFKGAQGYHSDIIRMALRKNLPVNAAAVDAYTSIKLPEGYTREGDRYVFKPISAAATPAATQSPPAPEATPTGTEKIREKLKPKSQLDKLREINPQAVKDLQQLEPTIAKALAKKPAEPVMTVLADGKPVGTAKTFQEASVKWGIIRQKAMSEGMGQDDVPGVELADDSGKIIGHVTWNGKVYEGPMQQAGNPKVLFDNAPVTGADKVRKQIEAKKATNKATASTTEEPAWRKILNKETDPNQRNSILERVANAGRKATDADLVEVLGLIEEDKVGSNAWGVAWAVAQNPAASAETKARALAMREDWMMPGRVQADEATASKTLPESLHAGEPVTTPKGATFVRVNGTTTVPLKDIGTLKGAGPFKSAEFGVKGKSGFVAIKDQAPKLAALREKINETKRESVKPSWMMTRDEYARGAKVRREMDRNYVMITGPDGKEVITRTIEPGQPEEGLIEGAHRVEIAEALREGKPVPASVLADYPDLQPAPARPVSKTEQLRGKATPVEAPTVKGDDVETKPEYKPGNPFAAKAIAAKEKSNRLNKPTAREEAMAKSFPLGVGGSGRRPQNTDRQIESSLRRSSESVKALEDARYWESKAKAFDEGKINAQGRSINPESIARSEKRSEYQDAKQARIDAAKAEMEGKEPWEVSADTYAMAQGYLVGSGRDLILNDHKELVEKARSEGKIPAAETVAKEKEIPSATTYAASSAFLKRAKTELVTAKEAQDLYAGLKANRDAVIAEIRAKIEADPVLKKKRKATKDEIAAKTYDARLEKFGYLTNDALYYVIDFKDPKGSRMKALDDTVASLTDEAIKAHFEKNQADYAEKKKAVENPETLKDFNTFIAYRGEKALSPEQLAKYDALRAEAGMAARESRNIEQKGTLGPVAGAAETPMEIVEREHSKRGHKVFIVKMGSRVDGDTFKELAGKAKALKGNWSREWRPTDSPAGFMFNDRESAEKFMSLRTGTVDQTAKVEESKEETREAAADRLSQMADKMEQDGNDSLTQDRKANTAKRAREAGYAEESARAQIAMARTLRNISEAVKDGRAKFLKNLRTRTQVEALKAIGDNTRERLERDQGYGPVLPEKAKFPQTTLWADNILSMAGNLEKKPGGKMLALQLKKYASGEKQVAIPREMAEKIVAKGDTYQTGSLGDTLQRIKRLEAMNITNDAELRSALREYLDFKGEKPAENKAAKLRREIVGKNVGVDYFPTPPTLAGELVSKADIRSGESVLEPSAGDGQIADRIRTEHPDAPLAVVEQSSSLRAILEAENHNVVGQDFLDYQGKHDKIVMNPPFNDEVNHVKHAYDLLNPGGRMVSVMSEHAFFASDKESKAFRDWLEEVGGISEQNPEGSFTDATVGRTTGTNTRTVVIDKPTGKMADREALKQVTITISPETVENLKAVGVKPEITPETVALQSSLNKREFNLRRKYGDQAFEKLAQEAEGMSHEQWLDLTTKILEGEKIGTEPLYMTDGDQAIADGVSRYTEEIAEIEEMHRMRGEIFQFTHRSERETIAAGRKFAADNKPAGMEDALTKSGIDSNDPSLGTFSKDEGDFDVYLLRVGMGNMLAYLESGDARDGQSQSWFVEINDPKDVSWNGNSEELIGNGEFDKVKDFNSDEPAIEPAALPKGPDTSKFVKDLRTTGVAYLENGARFSIQSNGAGRYDVEYTSPDRKSINIISRDNNSHDAAINNAVELASMNTDKKPTPVVSESIPSVEVSQKALAAAQAKEKELRTANEMAKAEMRDYDKEHNLTRQVNGTVGYHRVKPGDFKQSAPQAKREVYNKLRKAAVDAEAVLLNHIEEVVRPAQVTLNRSQFSKVANDETMPEVSRLTARRELTDRNSKDFDTLDKQALEASKPLASEMYPDATPEEVDKLAPMILSDAYQRAREGEPLTILRLKQMAQFETRLQMQPIRREMVSDALKSAGLAPGSYEARAAQYPIEKHVDDAFNQERSDILNNDNLSSKDVQSFLEHVKIAAKDAQAKLDKEQARQKREEEQAEKERQRIESEPIPEAPQGAEWKPSTLSKKPADRDTVLKMVMKGNKSLPILSMMEVRNGIGRTTDLEVDASIPVDLPDGVYTQPPKSKTWIKTDDSLDDFPPTPEIAKDAQKVVVDGAAFRKALMAVIDAPSTDQTRYILNSVLVRVKNGEMAITATDGRRLHTAIVGKVKAPDMILIIPTKSAGILLKSNGQGDLTIRVGGKLSPASEQYAEKLEYTKSQLEIAKEKLADKNSSDELKKIYHEQVARETESVKRLEADMVGSEKRKMLNPDGPVEFSDGNAVIKTKLIDGSYPNYEQVIPRDSTQKLQVEVDRKALWQALADVIPFLSADPGMNKKSTDRTDYVKLTITPESITILAANGNKQYHRQKTVKVSSVPRSGEEIQVALQPNYLEAMLSSSDSPAVKIGAEDSLSAVTLASPDGKTNGVIMPMRLSARGDMMEGQPSGITRDRFDSTLADETRGLKFASEGVWAGRFDDLDPLTKAQVEGGEGQASMTDSARSIIEKFKADLAETPMDKEQREIHDVVTGGKSETEIKISDLNNLEYALLESGNRSFGAKHILFKHFSGEAGPVTAQEIIDIGRFIRNSVLDKSKSTNTEHTYKSTADDGSRITVVLGKNRDGDKTVITFYSNRKEAIGSGTHNGTTKTSLPHEKNIPNSTDNVKPRFHRSPSGQVRAATIGKRSFFFLDRYDNESQLRQDIREEAGHRLINELGGAAWSKIGFLTYKGQWTAIRDEIKRNYGHAEGSEAFNHELVAKALRDGKNQVGLLTRFMDAVISAFKAMARRMGFDLNMSDAEVRNFLNGLLQAKAIGMTRRGVESAPAYARGESEPTDARTEAERQLYEILGIASDNRDMGRAEGQAEGKTKLEVLMARVKAQREEARQKQAEKINAVRGKSEAMAGPTPKTDSGVTTMAVRAGELKATASIGEMLREYDNGTAAQKIAEGRMSLRGAVTKLLKATASEHAQARRELVDAINAKLPDIESRRIRQFLSMLTRSQITDQSLDRALAKIDAIAEKQQKRELVGAIKAVYAKSSESMGVNVLYRQRIKKLMEGFLLTKPSAATLAEAKELADFLEQEKNSGSDMDLTLNRHMARLLRALAGTPLSDMPVASLEDLFMQIGRLGFIGRIYQQAKTEGYQASQDAAIERLRGSVPIEEHLKRTVNPLSNEELSLSDKFKNLMGATSDMMKRWYVYHMPMDVVFDLLDGAKHYAGENYRLFKSRIDLAFSGFRSEMQSFENELADKLKELGLTNDKKAAARIQAYAYDQQATGREKLLNTFSDGTEAGDAATNAMLDSIKLTENEMAFYTWARGKIEANRGAIEKVMNEVYNTELVPVENYWPMMTDWDRTEKTANVFGLEMDADGNFVKTPEPTGGLKKNVSASFTVKRRGAGDQILKMNAFHNLHKHIQDVNYYVHVGPTVKYLQEIANRPDYGQTVGSIGQKIVREYLDTMARQGGMNGSHILRWVDSIRNNIGVGTLGFRLSSILIQPSSFFDGAGLIGGRWAFKGALNITDRSWHDFIWKNMTEIHDRIGDDWAFGEASLRSQMAKKGFWLLQKLDAITAESIASGAYEKNLHERGLEVDFANPDAEALAYAQKMVRRTQASPSYKDQPLAVTRGALMGGSRTLARAIYQFQTFSMNKFSFMMHDGLYSAAKNKEPLSGISIMAWTALAFTMEEMIRAGLRAGPGGSGDDTDKEAIAKNFLMDYLQIVPWFGSAVSALTYSSFPAPVVSTIADTFKGLKSMTTAKSPEAKQRGAVRLAGGAFTMAGVPGASQAAQWGRNTIKSDPEEVSYMIRQRVKGLSRDAGHGQIMNASRQLRRQAIQEGLIDGKKVSEMQFYKRVRDSHERLRDR